MNFSDPNCNHCLARACLNRITSVKRKRLSVFFPQHFKSKITIFGQKWSFPGDPTWHSQKGTLSKSLWSNCWSLILILVTWKCIHNLDYHIGVTIIYLFYDGLFRLMFTVDITGPEMFYTADDQVRTTWFLSWQKNVDMAIFGNFLNAEYFRLPKC